MEQVTLPEGDDRLLLLALLTKGGVPRRRVTARQAAKLLEGSARFRSGVDLEAALTGLAGRGLLELQAKGKERAYQVTQAAASALKPPAAARKALPRAATLADLQALEERLGQRLDEILRRLGREETKGPAANGAQIESAIPAAIEEADRRGRHGGLVPIPEVRRLVLQRTGASRAQFDEALLAMERAFRVDLKIADDGRRPDAHDGIPVPGRGLVYYALIR